MCFTARRATHRCRPPRHARAAPRDLLPRRLPRTRPRAAPTHRLRGSSTTHTTASSPSTSSSAAAPSPEGMQARRGRSCRRSRRPSGSNQARRRGRGRTRRAPQTTLRPKSDMAAEADAAELEEMGYEEHEQIADEPTDCPRSARPAAPPRARTTRWRPSTRACCGSTRTGRGGPRA